MKILTAEQVHAVLEASGDFRAFVEVCVFAGLRLGEAAGLQLGDVNFLGRTISVRRQVQGSTNKAATLMPPKYGSERTIFVPGELTVALSAHVATEGITVPGAQLFRAPLERLWHRNNAGEEWRRIREAVKLGDDVTLHTPRHTFASNLIASGCDVVTVQRALGHSQSSITLNVYSHLWPSAEDKTACRDGRIHEGSRRGRESSNRGHQVSRYPGNPYWHHATDSPIEIYRQDWDEAVSAGYVTAEHIAVRVAGMIQHAFGIHEGDAAAYDADGFIVSLTAERLNLGNGVALVIHAGDHDPPHAHVVIPGLKLKRLTLNLAALEIEQDLPSGWSKKGRKTRREARDHIETLTSWWNKNRGPTASELPDRGLSAG